MIQDTLEDSFYVWPTGKTLKQFVKSTAIDVIEDNLMMFYDQLTVELDNVLATLEQCELDLQMAMSKMSTLMDQFIADSHFDEDFIRLVNMQ